jgi:RimJ/RimL family protein N-acetyltransferase
MARWNARSTNTAPPMMSNQAEIRRLGVADAEAFSALRRKVVADNPVPMGLAYDEELTRPIEGFRNQLSFPAPNAAFGAFADGELIGSAAIAWPSKWPSSRHKAELWGILVSPSFRGRGIGRQLVSKTLDHARHNDVRRVNLLVYVPNPPAVALYESLGFAYCGVEPEAIRLDGHYYDGQHMTLLLQAE